VDVLLGKDNDKIRQFNHAQVSTYGVGKELDTTQWRSVYRQLVARGYLTVDMDGYGSLQLTEKCRPLLRGEEQLFLRRDAKGEGLRQKRSAHTGSLSSADHALWEALRAYRKLLAGDQGVPPYVIFHDASLMDMVAKRPSNLKQMEEISGVGASKLERYGDKFLAILQQHHEKDREHDGKIDTRQHTFSCLREGMSVQQIAVQRGVTENTIYSHIADLIGENRLQLSDAVVLSEVEILTIEDALLAQFHTEGLRFRPVYESLDETYHYGVLRCVWAALTLREGLDV